MADHPDDEHVILSEEELVEEWADSPRRFLRLEMTRQNLSFADLAARLGDIRIVENERNLRNKIARGSFSATFFLQCLVAMGVSSLDFSRELWPHQSYIRRRVPSSFRK